MANNNLDDQNQSFEAKQAAENVAKGKERTAKVNVDADYEAAKKMSASGADQDEAGTSGTEGNPDNYRDMAKQVKPKK